MKKIDDLFKNSFENHEVTPSQMAWERLENRLDKSKKTAWLVWGKWAAAAVLFLTTLSLFLFSPDNQSEDRYLTTSRDFNPKTPPYAESKPMENADEGLIEDKEKLKPNPKGIHSPDPVNKKIDSEIKTHTFPDGGIASREESKKSGTIILEEETSPDFSIGMKLPHELPEIVASIPLTDHESIDYKVKIISRGYAFQPEKETLVNELENKIGSFFNKVDHGFSDLQDKKDNLFASITTKKSK